MGRSGDSCIIMTLWHSMNDVDALAQSRTYKDAVQQILAKGFLLREQTTEAFEVHTLDVWAA